MPKVLLTGGSGFIAAHCLDQLLQKGYSVLTTVRSVEKAQKLREAYKASADKLEVAIVPDIAQDGAFDEVAKTPGLEFVIHMASPFHFNFTDGLKEIVTPALNGTLGILRAIKQYAPSVKRVVVTSSFAAILDEDLLADPKAVFSEASWNPDNVEDISRGKPTTYRVSKKVAEKAAWDFVADEKPNFDLVTVNPPLVVGPVEHHLATLDGINTSNERFVALVQGKWKTAIPPTGVVDLWVDVRDVALTHVLGMELSEAGGKRLFPVEGHISNRHVADIVREHFPELKDKLPGPDVEGGEPNNRAEYYSFNNDATTRLLNMKWTPLEQSIVALVSSLQGFGV